MIIRVDKNRGILDSTVFYSKTDKSLNSVPALNSAISLAIKYVQIGVDDADMHLCSVWGLCPRKIWQEKRLVVPNDMPGAVSVCDSLDSGMSYRLFDLQAVYYDPTSNWLCLGDDTVCDEDESVRFLKNAIVTIRDGMIKALWINPEYE